MKKIFSRALVISIKKWMWLAVILLLPLTARAAGVNEGSVEISPFIGFNFFQPPQNLNNNLLYGGRVSYNFSRVFGLEGTLEFSNTNVADSTITGNQEGQFRSPINNVTALFYNLDAVFNLWQFDNFTLFALGGFGGANFSPSIETSDMSTFDLGVGAKYWLTDNFGLRLDVRDNMVTQVFAQGGFLNYNYQNINTTVGVVFAFGGENKKKEEARKAAAEVIYLAEEQKAEERIADIAATPEEKTVVLAFEDVHFKFGKATLSNNAKAAIKTTIEKLKDNPRAHIRIAGYTSEAGTDAYNMTLSERRAKAVEDYLIEEGLVSKDRLTTIGYGDTRPDMHEASPQNHYSTAAKANMRVLFEVVVQ
jgi:OOP family OmpA-OmpF porin